MIDAHVYLSRWPFRRLPDDDTASLVARLHSNGITQAWTGSFDGVLHRDVTGVNARLAAECRNHGEGLLVPFGTIDPTLAAWEDDLRRCVEEHGMPGIRLHPNYHGYTLDAPEFAALLDAAGARNLVVQIVARLEDERTQHPLVRVPVTDLRPLEDQLKTRPDLRVVLSCAIRGPNERSLIPLAAGRTHFDLATLEGIAGLERLLKMMPYERLLFGSLFPLFYLESAVLKLRESEIGHVAETAVTRGNAERLLSGLL